MAPRQTADKQLTVPMMTQFTDAYMRHQVFNLHLPVWLVS